MAVSSQPSNIAPGGEGKLVITATNLGDATATGSKAPITIRDTLPPGLVVSQPHMLMCRHESPPEVAVCGLLTPNGNSITCVTGTISCTVPLDVGPYEQIELEVGVKAEEPAGTETRLNDTATIEGGGIAAATLTRPIEISPAAPKFGVSSYEFEPEEENGSIDSNGGSHPFQLTTTVISNTSTAQYEFGTAAVTPELLRNLQVSLPPGFVGNPTGVPQCREVLFVTHPKGETNLCPGDSAVGVAIVRVWEPLIFKEKAIDEPVFNLEPAEGEPARFGFQAVNVPVVLDTALAGADHHVVVTASDTSEDAAILSSEITIWGSPSDPRHDRSRGYECLSLGSSKCEPLASRSGEAFLSLPTHCETGPGGEAVALQTSARAQSWLAGAPLLEPIGVAFTQDAAGAPNLGTSCGALPFTPSLTVEPDERTTNTPTGLAVDLHVPQGPTLDPAQRAEADLRNQTITLPQGVQLNPAAADGLTSCSEEQIGYTGGTDATGQLEFTSEPAHCPERSETEPLTSKLGTVEVHTPLLSHPLFGSVYLAAQNANPFNSRFAIYLVIDDAASGVRVKLAGHVETDAVTGRVTTTFAGAPQLPFEDLELHLLDGPRAALATPRTCSTTAFTTSASYTPWSSETPLPQTLPGEQFAITSGAHGTPCPEPQPFGPSVQGGSANPQAGAFTSFSLSIARTDTDQALRSTSIKLPEGLAGMVSKVQQCPEAQANAGTCGAGSLIGEATAIVGLGEDPFTERGGRVYFTGPYGGAPFGLSIVLPAKAGPFDFGSVVTRAAITVDPATAAITITSTLPTMLNTLTEQTGVPVQLRRVDITVARPGGAPFQFNPTNCSAQQITAALGGEQGAIATVPVPFRVSGCEKLAFTPGLSAATNAHVSRLNGTSLEVAVTAHEGQANIAKTKIVFPPQLPSRLTTLHGACLEAVFNANPATCPAVSVIGTATAHTPVLSSPLSGPVYLVSHGSAAFPDAEIVLQGEGVTLVLDGLTNIHNGITSSTFNAVPDAPVSSFVVDLPSGPHSAFTGYGNMCPTKPLSRKVRSKKRVHGHLVHVVKTVTTPVLQPLSMPTTLTGQNGDVIERITPLKVSGCTIKAPAKAKAKARHKKSKKRKK
jgi:uncharacterized repeat protein (TIGR01451 family)